MENKRKQGTRCGLKAAVVDCEIHVPRKQMKVYSFWVSFVLLRKWRGMGKALNFASW